MKFINVKNKKLRWYNRNLFYIGTIIIVLINVLAFLYKDNNCHIKYSLHTDWNSELNFDIIDEFCGTELQ